MSKNLVIVESPTKAKTITRFLGKDFTVLASMGHIRDLPKSQMGIDIDNNFVPTYKVSKEKTKVVKELKAALKKSDKLWIATDEDREGEAIGWHLLSALNVDPEKTPTHRIVFHEITEPAIRAAIENPREIDQNVVNAQQARRILDRLVGYELSPLLWRKIRHGLSAGRVQSVAVRLVVDREREINAFTPEEYWSIIATLVTKEGQTFEAELQKYNDKKIKISSESETDKIFSDLKGAIYQVANIEQKEINRNPAPPFITSTLQQEASRKLGFSVKKTMMVAQQLYEGIDIGSGPTGLITYMRTDSVNLSQLALTAAKKVITETFGHEYALADPRRYRVAKSAQEAHEAIRPADLSLPPEMVKNFLDRDQYRLYELIWKRTIACQMAAAVLNQTAVDVKANDYTFRATGQTIKFAGFMKVYLEGRDLEEEENEDRESFLPALSQNEILGLENLSRNQHFTKPPARYTEASLVKKLESEGIGRPSTYAPTISTIITRNYIEKDGKALKPTDLGIVVTDMLSEHFSQIIDYKFTAEMEDKLDNIEEGKLEWEPMIREFYTPFHKLIENKGTELQKGDLLTKKILGTDPKSNLDVIVRHGRFGSYVQLGEWSEEDRKNKVNQPKRASLPRGTNFETVTLEDALKLLEFPKILGTNEQGQEVSINLGPYGPYVRCGKTNASVPPEVKPTDVSLEQAKKIISDHQEKRALAATPLATFGPDPVSKGEIVIKNGRFGPYITDGKTNAAIPKSLEISDITEEKAIELLAKKRSAPKRVWRRNSKK